MDESRPILYNFENGILCGNAKEKVNIACMQSASSGNKRILKANAGGLEYTGNVLQKNQSQVRYYIGVVDKKSKRIERVESCLQCTLKPKIQATTTTTDKNADMKYRDKLDNLIEAFGSAKQKRGLSARKKNEKVHDTMSDKVKKVVEGVLERKPEIAQTPLAPAVDSIENEVLPPRNLEAVNVNDIFHLDDIISYRMFQKILPHAQELLDFKAADIETWRNDKTYSNLLLDHLACLPEVGQERERKAVYLIYLDCMMTFSQLKYSDIKKGKEIKNIPADIVGFLFNDFTEENNQNGQRFISKKIKDKLLCYILILALIIDGFQLNCRTLMKDLKIGLARIVKMLRFIGCSVSTKGTRKRKESGEPSDPEVVAVLNLPKDKKSSTSKETPLKKEPETANIKEQLETASNKVPETPSKETETPVANKDQSSPTKSNPKSAAKKVSKSRSKTPKFKETPVKKEPNSAEDSVITVPIKKFKKESGF